MTRIAVTLAVLAAGAGCQTPVGNYFANRARDFGECWRLQVGMGYGLGVGARALGVASLGCGMGGWRTNATIGIAYGDLYPRADAPDDEGEFELGMGPLRVCWYGPVLDWKPALLFLGGTSPLEKAGYGEWSLGVLPALIAWRGVASPSAGVRPDLVPGERPGALDWGRLRAHWLWGAPPAPYVAPGPLPRIWTHARLHAFDCEAWAFAVCVGVRAGFSPGEFVDFLLGWFGADIADDDQPLRPEAGR